MALRLEKCDTVLRGNFNPYVITPEWLAQQAIWQPKQAEVGFGALVRGLRFRDDSVEWNVDTDKLVVSSVSEDTGKLAAKVLRLLIHTPVIAVGNNCTFAGDLQDWGDSPVPMLGNLGIDCFTAGLEPEQVRWSGIFKSEKYRIEITVVRSKDGVAVQFNFHRPTSNATTAADAAEEFDNDKKTARTLLKQILNQEVRE